MFLDEDRSLFSCTSATEGSHTTVPQFWLQWSIVSVSGTSSRQQWRFPSCTSFGTFWLQASSHPLWEMKVSWKSTLSLGMGGMSPLPTWRSISALIIRIDPHVDSEFIRDPRRDGQKTQGVGVRRVFKCSRCSIGPLDNSLRLYNNGPFVEHPYSGFQAFHHFSLKEKPVMFPYSVGGARQLQ